MIPNTGLRYFPLISKTLLLELRTAPRDHSNPGEQPTAPLGGRVAQKGNSVTQRSGTRRVF